jgi:HD-GYP domain-containing protein (c-di-GMP phosphodiesterase class II)
VLHHHERWDGQGYPSQLAGEEIPIPARILFVADSYDTMTTDRVYQAKVTRAEALAEIDRCSGTQFDPTVVDALRDELASETPLELVLPQSA